MQELVGDAGRGEEWVWVRILVSGQRIVDATGEGPGTRELARGVRGLTLLEAAGVSGERLAVDALANALGPAVEAPQASGRVAVAMSGGVDSAVALLHARAEGHEPIGVTLRLWLDPAGPTGERACCSPSAVIAARELCHDLGLPHLTLDRRSEFREAVVGPFIESYAAGETPNPCVRCNGQFRFDELLRAARRIGAATLVTGHYARQREHRGRLLLARASDSAKDQSYMLGAVDPRQLPSLWFPLGEQSKDATRAEARAAGMAVAERPESQEACFLAGGDYRDFLERHGLAAEDGPVLDLDGSEVGRHRGHWRFTVGQRRGLGIASTDGPLYAVASDPRRNTVVVGPREALAQRSITTSPGSLYVRAERVEAKLRYRSPGVAAHVEEQPNGFRLELAEPFFGAARGQAAVLYEDDVVVGSGRISSARPGE